MPALTPDYTALNAFADDLSKRERVPADTLDRGDYLLLYGNAFRVGNLSKTDSGETRLYLRRVFADGSESPDSDRMIDGSTLVKPLSPLDVAISVRYNGFDFAKLGTVKAQESEPEPEPEFTPEPEPTVTPAPTRKMTVRRDYIESCARWLADFYPEPSRYNARFWLSKAVVHNAKGNAARTAYLDRLDLLGAGSRADTRFYQEIARRTAELVAQKTE